MKAVENGAGAVLVNRPVQEMKESVAVVQVNRYLEGFGQTGPLSPPGTRSRNQGDRHYRKFRKTTVKEMTAAIFEEQDKHSKQDTVLKTRGNLNNLIGLPLSLLQVNAGHRTIILEMGMNHTGEIKS